MTVSRTAATPSTSERSSLSKGTTSSSPAIPSAQRLGNRHLQSLLRARLIQAKLTVSHPQDMYEQEADRVADQVMRMAEPASPKGMQPAAIIQRTCHQCEEELRRSPSDMTSSGPGAIAQPQALNRSPLQRFGDGAAEVPTVDAATERAIGALSGRGAALPKSVRTFMEPRFNADFGKVRVHTGAEADQLARAVNAQAFTVRDNIVFGAGQYKPDTDGGKRLLAHELTHVVQQGGGASVVQRAPLEGTARLDDHDVHLRSSLDLLDPNTNAPAVPDLVSGSVTRRQYNEKNEEIHAMDANVRFDPRNCTVTIPVGIAYREPIQADLDQFESVNRGRTAKALKPGAGREVFDRYLAVTNDRLNGWFAAKFGECKGAPCSGRTVPIVVEVVERTSNPDYAVIVLDGGKQGRAYVAPGETVVLAGDDGDVDDPTMAHEGGHMALGVPDEYLETERSRRDVSRVRETDFSLMADPDGYRGWALLHERHFHFVATFLEAALKAMGTPCKVTLEALSRPTKFDFRAGLWVGGSRLGSGWGLALDASLGVGVLSSTRNWRAFLDAHVSLLSSFDAASRGAFLLGARLGVERRFTPSAGGLTIGGFVGAGRGSFEWIDTSNPRSLFQNARLGFGEVGARAGHGFSPGGGFLATLFAEAAAGSTININDASQQHWFRIGLGVGVEF